METASRRIPDNLITEIQSNKCSLFVGAGLSRPAGFPSWKDLIINMIAFCDVLGIVLDPAKKKELSQLIEDKEYITAASFLRERLDKFGFSQFVNKVFKIEITSNNLPSVYKYIPQIPFANIITTNYDRILEFVYKGSIFHDNSRCQEINDLVRDREFFIYKIHGSIENLDSIVLGKKDYREKIYGDPLFINTITNIVQGYSLLFAGYSFEDPYLRDLLEGIKYLLKSRSPFNYILIPNSQYNSIKATEYQNSYNIITIPFDESNNYQGVEEFFSGLAQHFKNTVTANETKPSTLDEKGGIIPFKFLEPFDFGDEGLFFGRANEINKISSIIDISRLTLIFGKSGVGKTSLIKVGIIPALTRKGYMCIYYRISAQPVEGLISTINQAISKNSKESNAGSNSVENYSKTVQDLRDRLESSGLKIVLFIDQFEEAFTKLNLTQRQVFFEFIQSVFNELFPFTRINISFREDFLPQLTELKNYIPEVFTICERVTLLSFENAREAIIKPLNRAGITYEADLIDLIIKELNLSAESEGGSISPPQLQIVLFTLITSNYPKPNEAIQLTKETYYHLGGVKGILSKYLDVAIESLSYKQRQLAISLLKRMVSPIYTRIPIKENEIFSIYETSPDKTDVQFVLNELINKRIIVKSIIQDVKQYELSHEYVIEKIQEWMQLDKIRFFEAKDFLDQLKYTSINNFIENGDNKFGVINNNRGELFFDGHSKLYMLINSFRTNVDLHYWLEQNLENDFVTKSFIESNILALRDSRLKNAILVFFFIFSKNKGLQLAIEEALPKHINPYFKDILGTIKQYFNIDISDKEIYLNKLTVRRILYPMVYIPEGEFIMGRDKEEILSNHSINYLPISFFEGEFPKRDEFVSDFLVSKYLVTNGLYQEFDEKHSFKAGDENKPVTNIDFLSAKKFLNWVGMSMPNKVYWEKAARGTDGRQFPWGNEWDPTRCNTRLSGISSTTEVDKYQNGRSPFGCFDMAGNVWEWTESIKASQNQNVIKGGSWTKMNILPWSSYEFESDPNEGLQNLGFRGIIKVEEESSFEFVFSAGTIFFQVNDSKIQVLLGKDDRGWRIPKGMRNGTESLQQTAIRETKEETGGVVTNLKFIDFKNWAYRYGDKLCNEICFFFKADLVNLEKIHDPEFSELRWFTEVDALASIAFLEEREILQMAFQLK